MGKAEIAVHRRFGCLARLAPAGAFRLDCTIVGPGFFDRFLQLFLRADMGTGSAHASLEPVTLFLPRCLAGTRFGEPFRQSSDDRFGHRLDCDIVDGFDFDTSRQ